MCRSTLRLIRNYVRSNKHSGHVLDSPPNTARQVEFPGIPGTNTGDLGVGRAARVPYRRADSLPGYCPARSGSARAPRLTSRLGRCTSAQCPPAAACRSDGGRRGAARRVGIVPCSCDCGARARPDARPRACVTGASAATAERGLYPGLAGPGGGLGRRGEGMVCDGGRGQRAGEMASPTASAAANKDDWNRHRNIYRDGHGHGHQDAHEYAHEYAHGSAHGYGCGHMNRTFVPAGSTTL